MDPIQEILESSKTIAVVGLSGNPARPSHGVAEYLQRHGYKIIPVNPNENQVLDMKAYPDLLAVPEIVQQAIQKKAKIVWMQPGAENYAAADVAQASGLKTVVGMCMRTEHQLWQQKKSNQS